MDASDELKKLGFKHVGAMLPVDGGRACQVVMDRDVIGFVVYAHVVDNQIKKFGTTKAPLRSRVGQNASTISQVIALLEGRVMRDARWHHRQFDAFKRLAPDVIKANRRIDVWALVSNEAQYKSLERKLNAKFDTMRNGWAMQLG